MGGPCFALGRSWDQSIKSGERRSQTRELQGLRAPGPRRLPTADAAACPRLYNQPAASCAGFALPARVGIAPLRRAAWCARAQP